MIKRLRLKFVVINMSIVTIMLCVILGLVYYFTRADLETESVNMMRTIASQPVQPGIPSEPGEDVRLPFFTVQLGPKGKVMTARGSYYDLSDKDFLDALVQMTSALPRDFGVIEEYNLRYYRAVTPFSVSLVFSDISSERATLSGLVQSSLLTFEPVFFERGLAFSAQVDESVTVSGEAEKLSRAVEILLDNAAKYSREGGQVRVSLQRRMKGRCLLTVASQGQGLSPQELKDIFKRFYRADPARSNDGSFGLGLPIAQSIVTRHGGRIWAESRDGVNSFYIELPCA